MEYSEGMVCVCCEFGASDTRWDLKASSTVGPVVDIGLGVASAMSKLFKNKLGLVRARTAHSFSPAC